MVKHKLTKQSIKQLRYINNIDLHPGYYALPDFLIIGPQRTGTTWMAKHLMNHPEVHIPVRKEIYFFNYLNYKDGPRYQSDRLEWYSNEISPNLFDFIKFNYQKWKTTKKLSALEPYIVKYFNPTIIGEATASYAVLGEEIIDEILLLNPDIKIITSIRNPIDRAWSHAKKDLVRDPGLKIQNVGFEKFKAFYTDQYQLKCANFCENIDRWSMKVEAGNIFICFLDSIRSKPDEVLTKLTQFLGINDVYGRDEPGQLTKAVNSTKEQTIPEQHYSYLHNLFKNELKKIENRFGIHWERK